ncbi:MAG: hypothetical protein ACTHP8_19175, partial [Bosea sp. (in: a-proteobacteria)]
MNDLVNNLSPQKIVRLADKRPQRAPSPRRDQAFTTILFPPGLEALRVDRSAEPDCFTDLNLDQVVGSAVAKRDEDVLRPIFYSPCRD